MPARRTEPKVMVNNPAAFRACLRMRNLLLTVPPRGVCTAAFTSEEDIPLFYGQDGNKEQRDIMVRSHGFQLIETTGITSTGRFVQGDGFGMYSPYEEKHITPV